MPYCRVHYLWFVLVCFVMKSHPLSPAPCVRPGVVDRGGPSLCLWGAGGGGGGLPCTGPERRNRAFVTPTETHVHGHALRFAVKTWAPRKTREAELNNGGRSVAVGGWSLAVGGGWRWLTVGDGWVPWGGLMKKVSIDGEAVDG